MPTLVEEKQQILKADLPEFSHSKKPSPIKGIVFCAIFALSALMLSKLSFCTKFNLNSLTIAIVIGMILGNTLNRFIPEDFRDGITFSSKKVLRFAIVLYGFRITFAQIFNVGMGGFVADVIMLTSTYLLGYYLGTRVFKLDKDLCMLTAIGSSVCGAAAVLGTDSVLKAKSHKVSLAVATVVLFGTAAMFLYPLIYQFGLLDANAFGIYIGSTVHEVAQVVAAGAAVNPDAMDTAVIVKLTRVMMLVPYLFLLTLAMFALGLETNFEKIKNLGIKPLLLAFIMFVWLVGFGFIVNKFII